MQKITEQEFDELQKQGVAVLFDHDCDLCKPQVKTKCKDCDNAHLFGFGGYFSAKEGVRKDIILVSNNDGYFIRSSEDLVRSDDGIIVAFCENLEPNEKIPNFEDIFEVRKY